MADALEDHRATVCNRGRTISNLRFVDNTDGPAGSELELANVVERLDKTSGNRSKLQLFGSHSHSRRIHA